MSNIGSNIIYIHAEVCNYNNGAVSRKTKRTRLEHHYRSSRANYSNFNTVFYNVRGA